MAEIVEMGRQLQPGLLVANRTVGDFEDFVTPEREIPDEALPEAWEACLPLAPDWKYTEGQQRKSAEEVFEEISVTNQRGGNFLLGTRHWAEVRRQYHPRRPGDPSGDWTYAIRPALER
jgi:alpha-L-fucosidase